MPIPVITNFDINASAPIDSRMVVANSTDRTNIVYKYQGLKVFQTSDNTSWFWTGTSWSVEPNGIYGGSGSLSGNTEVYLGLFDESSMNTNKLSFTSKNDTTLISRVDQYIKSSGIEQGFSGTQYIIEYNGNGVSGPYIKMNRQDSDNIYGGIGFGVGIDSQLEGLVIRGDGRVGIKTNPSANFQVGSSSSVYAPITINTGPTSSLIGFNWFEYGNTTKKFNNSNSAAQLLLDPNNFYIRTTGTSSTTISTRFLISPTEIRLYGRERNDNAPGGESGASYKHSHNEFFGQIRSTQITKPSTITFSRSRPNYSFSNMADGGLYLENTDISISNSGKKAFSFNENLQTIRYFDNSDGNSTSYVMSGSRGVRGSSIDITPSFTMYTIATFSIPENLSSHTSPEFIPTSKNGKIVFIEADIIGKITKFDGLFYFDIFRRFRFSNSYSINISDPAQISLLTSTFSTLSNNVGSFGLSASISFTRPNIFSLEYFFGASKSQSGINIILSAVADYKVTVINDFGGDFDVVQGLLIK